MPRTIQLTQLIFRKLFHRSKNVGCSKFLNLWDSQKYFGILFRPYVLTLMSGIGQPDYNSLHPE